ncbi:MAG: hypothetical protein QNJ69_14210 [Gammaproteobacteria bacterium]|nr:hypothetical protein [Gammaproteobacteria bacterium]
MSSLILALFTAFMAALLGVAIVRRSQLNHIRERELRRGLIQRVEALPLPGLIQALGINLPRYFYGSPFKRLDECVKTCESCSAAQQCQSQLARPEVKLSEFSFCPIREHLGKHIN